jgi:hypothetical protein
MVGGRTVTLRIGVFCWCFALAGKAAAEPSLSAQPGVGRARARDPGTNAAR